VNDRGVAARPDRRLLAAVVGAIVVGAVAGLVLSSSGKHNPAAAPAATSGRALRGDSSVIRVARSRLGRILVDGKGRTLYVYTPDKRNRSVCYDGCSKVWPPATVPGRPRAGRGVSASALGTTRRRDHSLQVVYHGHPLYRMVADTRPGQIEGQGYDGVWFVVSPSGHRVLKGAARTKPVAGY
jgi:predicted lipoprotein with Yx(FWY)xxD motif